MKEGCSFSVFGREVRKELDTRREKVVQISQERVSSIRGPLFTSISFIFDVVTLKKKVLNFCETLIR